MNAITSVGSGLIDNSLGRQCSRRPSVPANVQIYVRPDRDDFPDEHIEGRLSDKIACSAGAVWAAIGADTDDPNRAHRLAQWL